LAKLFGGFSYKQLQLLLCTIQHTTGNNENITKQYI